MVRVANDSTVSKKIALSVNSELVQFTKVVSSPHVVVALEVQLPLCPVIF
jgi:hypothetical protein